MSNPNSAREATALLLAREATLQDVQTLIASIDANIASLEAKDFVTQTTLALIKARADLLATEATLAAISGKLPAALVGGRLDINLGASGLDPLKAREDTVIMTWVSVKSAAPAANAVQADTGALAAGNYDFDVQLVCSDTVAVGKGLVLEHRNAANAATLFNLGGASPNGGSAQINLRRYPIAVNERLRVIAGTAAGAAASMYVSAIGRRIS